MEHFHLTRNAMLIISHYALAGLIYIYICVCVYIYIYMCVSVCETESIVTDGFHLSDSRKKLQPHHSIIAMLCNCCGAGNVIDKFHLWLQWGHDGRDGVSNHHPHDCLLNRVFRRRLKEKSKLRITGLCEGNSPVTGEFPTQRASNPENVSIWCVIWSFQI